MQQQSSDKLPKKAQKNLELVNELQQKFAQRVSSQPLQTGSITPQPVQKSRVLPQVPQIPQQSVINVQSLPSLQTTDVQIDTKLQAAFKALQNDEENKLLIQQFQNVFLDENRDLIEKLQKAISAFCQNPQNQDNKALLEKSLLAICLKMQGELQAYFTKSGDAFALAAFLVAQCIVSNITGLNVRHIQPLFLLQSDWKKESDTNNFCLLKGIMPHLLDQIRCRFPLSEIQGSARKKLNTDIGKINQKGALNKLACELEDYFDNRLFYDQKKTLVLIVQLKEKGIEVPQYLYTQCSFKRSEIETKSKSMLAEIIGGEIGKYGYMLNLGYINSLVIDNGSGCVTTHNLLTVFKYNNDTLGKCLFFIPGYIHIIFEKTDSGLRFKEFKASNSVLQCLMIGEVKTCNESILEAMVAQAKKEESPELLNEWYRAQSRIIFAKEFSEKYHDIFDCEAFKKKFEEEASEFLRDNEAFLNKLKFGFEKLFFEDKKAASERYKEEHKESYKFICNLYSVIIGNGFNSSLEDIKIPLPLPMISLDYHNDGLCVVIPAKAEVFIAVFTQHNANLGFIDFIDAYGNIHAVFSSAGLKEFLVACNVPEFAANEMVQNLYNALHKEKYKCILTLEALEKSSNSEIIDLKNHEWMHITINDRGEAFIEDTNRETQVNYRELNPGKSKHLISSKIDYYAKKFPLVKQYMFTHSQKCGYLFSRAIEGSLGRGNSKTGGYFMIAGKNTSKNIEFTETSATCLTNNNLLIIFDTFNTKGSALLFSIPGHIQTVFEMVGQYQLQAISTRAKEPIPIDMTLRKNPQKLYLYLNKDKLVYAVYDKESAQVKRIMVGDHELREKNAQIIKSNLKGLAEDQEFDKPENRAALLLFLKLTENAGYPILGLKLKLIKTSNSALRDLVAGNFEKCDEEMLAEMAARAKKEEPKESLYEWYKTQAVILFHDNFREAHQKAFNCDNIERAFYAEVQQFLSLHYKNPGDKFYQFIEEIQKLLKADEHLLRESASQKTLTSPVRRLSQFPQLQGNERQKTFDLFIKNPENINYKKDFQQAFLNVNEALVEKVATAIADFIVNPRKQFCRCFLEKCLFELTLKIGNDLKSDKPWDIENLSPVVSPILETMMGRIKGLRIQHIQSLYLLWNDWDKESVNEAIRRRSDFPFPKRVLEILLDQIRLCFPLNPEQDQAYKQLKAEVNQKNKDDKPNYLQMKVDDYFENRLFTNQKNTQELIEHLQKAGIEVPAYLSSVNISTPVKLRALPQTSGHKPYMNSIINPTTSQKNSGSRDDFKKRLSLVVENQSNALLINTVRSQPGNQQLAASISEIDKFREVLAKAFSVESKEIKDILVKFDNDGETICIYVPGKGLQTYNGIDDLKENFNKSDGFNQVNIRKLHQELHDDFKKEEKNSHDENSDQECIIS